MSRHPIPPLVHGIAFFLVFLAGALYPIFGSRSSNSILGLILILYIGAKFFWHAPLLRLQRRLAAKEWLVGLLTSVTSIVFLLGGLEIIGQVVTRAGWVEPYSAMRTLLPKGVGDFRRFHITADKYRIPDPVLFWRPINQWPYNEQHMKGPVAALPKPDNLYRIISFGDSNTDGPNEGTWSERLQTVLEDRLGGAGRYQVINAGVAGYSSHQGVLRFRQTVEEFEPDLIFVSFGWNDAAPAVTGSDRSYRLPSTVKVLAERWLLKYRFYRAIMTLRQPKAGEKKLRDVDFGPRVSLEEYRDNLEAFQELAGSHSITPVFLTRPYSKTRQVMEDAPHDMRRLVPSYNDVVRQFGADTGALMFDVRDRFSVEKIDVEPLFADDSHFSDQGTWAMADFLYESLIEEGVMIPPSASAPVSE